MDHKISDALEFDQDGFRVTAQGWDEDMAQKIAEIDGIGHLDEPRLMLLRQLRADYLRRGAPPALAHICWTTGLMADCMNQLFPSPREAWRIAGLPNPGDEAVVYL